MSYVYRILREKQWRRILLVSSPYHMRRAQLVWQKVAPEIVVTPTPPQNTQFYEHTVGASLEQVGGILQEYTRPRVLLAKGLVVIPSRLRKALLISVPAVILTVVVLAVIVEVWVRWTWDAKKGTPGFYETDPVRVQRLGPNYDGWFAGVPVHINSLGFRDTREYELAKRPNTFRILVLGDSVTFGHGSVFEHTYPYLLERQLRDWRPDIDWQVWNLGVPGYNTSQELAYLLDVGPSYAPDLVVVGFFENDIVANYPLTRPSWFRIMSSRLISTVRRHWYSTELYKRLYLTLAWHVTASKAYRLRFEHLATEENLTLRLDAVAEPDRQALTQFVRLSDADVASLKCRVGQFSSEDHIRKISEDPEWGAFVEAVRRLQQLHTSGAYSLMFFSNYAPPVCQDVDRFYDGGATIMNRFYMDLLSQGTPAVSSLDAFFHTLPSQMPGSSAHSFGNANVVKAEVIFNYLKDSLLTSLLDKRGLATPH